jgi:tetratricopeptide (TPR) repeat protein
LALGLEVPSRGDEVLATTRRGPGRHPVMSTWSPSAAGTVAAAPAVRSRAEALAAARSEIERGRASGDPRALGRAQAALGPWFADADADDDVRVLRATIHQSLHDFDRAERDLRVVVERNSTHQQAALTLATIYAVRAQYIESKAACALLRDGLAKTICLGNIRSLSGEAAVAEREVAQELRAPVVRSADELVWAVTALGEYAERRGALPEAERFYRKALEVAPRDPYALRSLADVLLDAGRHDEVVALLEPHREQDVLLLRIAVAARRAKRDDTAQRELAERFAAVRARNDRVHLREESWYERELVGDAPRALALALENWRVQREPADARVLLEAALAAGQPQEALPAARQVLDHHLEDPRLTALARRVSP